MENIISIKNLRKDFGENTAIKDLTLDIKEGEIFGFLGPSGAGKTTTIKMLTCLIPPTSGTAAVAGYDVVKSPDEVRQKIGMVPQLVSLYGDLTARENAELCADYYGMPRDLKEQRIDDLMELVDIKYAENKMVKQMSGGQKQKVSVVASLVHQPDILFLDEPTTFLDVFCIQALEQFIKWYEGTVVLVSHDQVFLDNVSDCIYVIEDQQLKLARS